MGKAATETRIASTDTLSIIKPMKKYELFTHQKEAVDRFRDIPRGLDLSDPGTGKTRVQLELFAERRANGGGRMLIIAPKSLLESAWDEDIRKFTPQLATSVCYAYKRDASFAVEADVYITNTDGTRWLAKQKPSFFKSFDTLVVDESSAFKHRTSLRSRCLKKIVKYFRYRYFLTGTPNANSILDIWHQALLVDDGERLGRSFMAFRQTMATPIQVGPQPNMVKWEDKPGSAQAVGDLLSDISVRYIFEECHDIPANHIYYRKYTPTPSQLQAYSEMEKNAILEAAKGEVITAVNAAALVTKLLQIASGAVYDEQGNSVHIEDDRYQLICDLVGARNHSLVFFNWKHQAENLVGHFKKEGITHALIDGTVGAHERAEVVKDFQKGYYRVLLAHPQSAAHGLTLTRATTTIWASPTYNLEFFLQGNRRIYRAGQTQKTETILVCAKNTMEKDVYAKLDAKNAKQLDFLRIIRELG
jgi:SNF2 family DNA or RNA helicase